MRVMKILVTGAAGFIGAATSAALLDRGDEVVGFDNLNAYYSVELKKRRLALLEPNPGFRFVKADLADAKAIDALFAEEKFDAVVHLAAQAGVRHSLEAPQTYVDSNVTGTLNVLEACRFHPVRHLVYASSSSVYGANRVQPFSADHSVDHPVSLYAATKKCDELMAHTYSHLFGIPTTGLRFFTVYGPWGRPDMALFLFADAIEHGRPIRLFNHGDMRRDFTYVDDIVEGVVRVLDLPPARDEGDDDSKPSSARAPYRVLNIGRGEPTPLLRFVELLEENLGKKAERILEPMQPGDVPSTWADVEPLKKLTGFAPRVSVEEGVRRFAEWWKEER
ncbi:MAG: NAD-dependent epimerase [Fibrobacterales bacterium]|nr:NAD-dependent epimerase [Fibrobacterales bacterium]